MINILSRKNILKLTLFFSIFILCIKKIADFDIFYHLKTGEYILKNGFLYEDIFSYTAYNKPWITHEWLSQVIFYLSYKYFGFIGLILLKSCLVLLTFYFVYKLVMNYRNLDSLSLIIIFFSAYICAPFFIERPQLFSFLFFAILLHLLSKNKLFLIPLVFLLWVNLHSGFILGLIILFLYFIFDENKKNLFFCLLFSLLFCLINPNLYKILIYPFYTIFNPHHISLIVEWQSPDFHIPHLVLFEMFLFIGIISFIVSAKNKNISLKDIILFLFLLHISLYSVRNIPFFAIAVCPLILKNLPKPSQINCYPQERYILNFIILVFLLSSIFFSFYIRFGDRKYIDEKELPVCAANFIKKNKLSGNIFNEYDWGGYLIWKLYPEHRVFIDGRQDIYSPEITDKYLKVINVEMTDKILNKYKVKYLLVRKESIYSRVFRKYTSWKIIYQDDIAIIFERENVLE